MFTGTIQAPSNRLRTPIGTVLLIGVFAVGAGTGVGIARVVESGTHGGAAAAAAALGRNLPGLHAIPGWGAALPPAAGLSPKSNFPGLYAIPGGAAALLPAPRPNLSALYAISGWGAAVLPAPGTNLSGLYAIPGWGAAGSSVTTSGDIVREWLARSK